MMQDSVAALKAYSQQNFFEQSPTISLADASLLTPSSPDSFRASSVDPQSEQSEKKQVRKRKSWGQELPIPKTNLPPRYVPCA